MEIKNLEKVAKRILKAIKDKEKIIDAFKDICGLTEFNESITTWTKTIKAINARLNLWRDRLEGAGIILPKFIVSSK